MADVFSEFIPEIWSAKILDDKKRVHVFGGLANRDYEGEIRAAGDMVRIPQVGYPTVNAYTRNNFGTGLTKETANVASLTMVVDQEKYVNMLIDDIDMIQSKPDFMGKIQQNIAYQLAQTQDAFIAGLYTQAGLATTSNNSSTRVTLGSSNVRTELLLMHKTFDANNVQRDGRWAVIPPELLFELVDAGILEQSNNDTVWVNGRVANAYGWNLYVSNNVTSTSAGNFNIMFGVGMESITLAEQITKVEAGRLTQEGFGEYIKALHVYGARVMPDRTGVMYATITN